MRALLGAMAGGDLGPLDMDRLYAGGISSGGYMTSRMAVSYPGTFRALAIQSASYATCAGSLCVIPALPADHPPTMFLHGEADPVVPIATMLPYAAALEDQATPVERVIDATAGHEWLEAAPVEVPAFFAAW
jgi:predicted esterase